MTKPDLPLVTLSRTTSYTTRRCSSCSAMITLPRRSSEDRCCVCVGTVESCKSITASRVCDHCRSAPSPLLEVFRAELNSVGPRV